MDPYIFEIDAVSSISPDTEANKTYRLSLSDIISATLKRVDYLTFLGNYPRFANYKNWRDRYSCLLDFALQIINITHKEKYKIDPTILEYDFYHTDDAHESSALMRGIFNSKNIKIHHSCFDVLNLLYNAASVQIEIPDGFDRGMAA